MRLQAAVGSTPLASTAQRDHFVQWLRLGQDGEAVRLHAYAVLPQTVLLLLTPQTAADLSRYVQALARQASRASATLAAHDGLPATVWAGRFQSALVQPGDWVLAAMQWIDRTAAEHLGETDAAHAALWSSRAVHCGEAAPSGARPALAAPDAYWQLGNTPFAREAAYRAQLQQADLSHDAAAFDAALRSGSAVGDADFLRQLQDESGRRMLPARRGRPRTKVA